MRFFGPGSMISPGATGSVNHPYGLAAACSENRDQIDAIRVLCSSRVQPADIRIAFSISGYTCTGICTPRADSSSDDAARSTPNCAAGGVSGSWGVHSVRCPARYAEARV